MRDASAVIQSVKGAIGGGRGRNMEEVEEEEEEEDRDEIGTTNWLSICTEPRCMNEETRTKNKNEETTKTTEEQDDNEKSRAR